MNNKARCHFSLPSITGKDYFSRTKKFYNIDYSHHDVTNAVCDVANCDDSDESGTKENEFTDIQTGKVFPSRVCVCCLFVCVCVCVVCLCVCVSVCK